MQWTDNHLQHVNTSVGDLLAPFPLSTARDSDRVANIYILSVWHWGTDLGIVCLSYAVFFGTPPVIYKQVWHIILLCSLCRWIAGKYLHREHCLHYAGGLWGDVIKKSFHWVWFQIVTCHILPERQNGNANSYYENDLQLLQLVLWTVNCLILWLKVEFSFCRRCKGIQCKVFFCEVGIKIYKIFLYFLMENMWYYVYFSFC